MKKELIRLHKTGSMVQSPGNDSGYCDSPITQDHNIACHLTLLRTGGTLVTSKDKSGVQLFALNLQNPV